MIKDVWEFQEKYPTKEAREKALKRMSNAQIDKIIDTCGTKQAKIYYSKFRSEPQKNGK